MNMLIKDIEKLKKARNIINLLLEGINPVSYEKIVDESFLNDPKLIRTFSYLALVLSQDIQEAESKEEVKKQKNIILKKRVIPGGNSINDNYKTINSKIKLSKMEVFNKVAVNAELKKLAQLIEKDEENVEN